MTENNETNNEENKPHRHPGAFILDQQNEGAMPMPQPQQRQQQVEDVQIQINPQDKTVVLEPNPVADSPFASLFARRSAQKKAAQNAKLKQIADEEAKEQQAMADSQRKQQQQQNIQPQMQPQQTQNDYAQIPLPQINIPKQTAPQQNIPMPNAQPPFQQQPQPARQIPMPGQAQQFNQPPQQQPYQQQNIAPNMQMPQQAPGQQTQRMAMPSMQMPAMQRPNAFQQRKQMQPPNMVRQPGMQPPMQQNQQPMPNIQMPQQAMPVMPQMQPMQQAQPPAGAAVKPTVTQIPNTVMPQQAAQPAPIQPSQPSIQQPQDPSQSKKGGLKMHHVIMFGIFILVIFGMYIYSRYKSEIEYDKQRIIMEEKNRQIEKENDAIIQATQQLQQQPSTKQGSRIEYKGSAEFQSFAQKAVELIWEYDKTLYNDLKQYIYVISQGPKTEFRELNSVPTIFLTETAVRRSGTWAASEIAHMFFHARNHYELAKQKAQNSIPEGLRSASAKKPISVTDYKPVEVDTSSAKSVENFEKLADNYQMQVQVVLGSPMSEINLVKNRKPGDYSITHDGF